MRFFCPECDENIREEFLRLLKNNKIFREIELHIEKIKKYNYRNTSDRSVYIIKNLQKFYNHIYYEYKPNNNYRDYFLFEYDNRYNVKNNIRYHFSKFCCENCNIKYDKKYIEKKRYRYYEYESDYYENDYYDNDYYQDGYVGDNGIEYQADFSERKRYSSKRKINDYIYLKNTCLIEDKNEMYLIDPILYLVSVLFAMIFENMSNYYIYVKTNNFNIDKYYKLINTVKTKLLEMSNNPEQQPLGTFWKGHNYYFEKMFEIPIILYNIDIPKENYQLRKASYFSDVICGHPSASNGWFQESLDNVSDLLSL